ncbi:MAG: hypothetical protein AAF716_08665 [Cyanobacteria bacterium P01_D01_bin.1]
MSENQSENQSGSQSKNQTPQPSPTIPSKGSQPGSSQRTNKSVSKGKSVSKSVSDLVMPDVPRQMTMGSIVPGSGSSLSEPNAEEMDDAWDAVDLPGTVIDSEIVPSGGPSGNLSAVREQELLTLIHDLNNCNDVLLAKVSNLESALSESQQSVRIEVERSQATQEKMLEQVLDQQSAAQQTAQTAQQQVAKLVGQLDTAEQTIKRQELIQETLRAELSEAQERINQLEHECALTTQQHADEAQARIKAETTNRDLRSRLQRQQRYTLQFKAALEKSLTVTARPAAVVNAPVVSDSVPFNEDILSKSTAGSVTMPKAERIVPWTAVGSAPFAGIDPHLENLIRGQADTEEPLESQHLESQPLESQRSEPVRSNNRLETASEPPQPKAENTQVPVVDTEAEAKLWQDLERVMGVNSQSTSADPDETSATKIEATETTENVEESAEPSGKALNREPRLNWQEAKSALPIDPTTESTADSQPLPPQSLSQQSLSQQSLSQQSLSPVASTTVPEASVAQAQSPEVQMPHTQQLQQLQDTDYIPLTDSEVSSVSPVVKPLRTQRKISSMAAVQLPTFEKAKAGSFKR